ncbi:RhuM family protein [Collinsella aerofaciens]|uniref:RhuM family protein n=1 Tax=Collinsella aerofaciens TaxID=74426 RepID=UPI002912A55F|nr:RhuM family protein [Collinsella aerofaciens]MDU8576288.1 RhuM family protein [Collinsella aerofaciens]
MTLTELSQQIALYENPDHTIQLEVRTDEDTVWLTQQQMAQLFGRTVPTINRHIKAALTEELEGIPTIAKYAIVQNEGKRTVEREVEHYNLDMILSVGYRVKSQQGIYFRRWANSVLKQHLVQGYTVNQKRLDTLKTVVKILERADVPEIAGSAELLNSYLPSLELLNDYDTGNLSAQEGKVPTWRLTHEDALEFVRSLPFYGESNLFGRERGGLFEGIVNALYQGFADQDLYPSVEAKAANLLYLVVKDHPFLDGNKRSAAALFVYFLDKNGLLKQDDHLLVEGNALAAMTLMVALSDPSEKDAMVALVENFIA